MAAGARRAAREEREREKERRGKQSDERGRRGRSSETYHNDKPGFYEGVTDESDRRR